MPPAKSISLMKMIIKTNLERSAPPDGEFIVEQ